MATEQLPLRLWPHNNMTYSPSLAASQEDLSSTLPQRVLDSVHSWVARRRSLRHYKKEDEEKRRNNTYYGVPAKVWRQLNDLIHQRESERRNKIYFDEMMACKTLNPRRKSADGVWICKCRTENEILVLKGQFPLGKLKCKLCGRPWTIEYPATGILIPKDTGAVGVVCICGLTHVVKPSGNGSLYPSSCPCGAQRNSAWEPFVIGENHDYREGDPLKIRAELTERLTGKPATFDQYTTPTASTGPRTPISSVSPGTTPIRMGNPIKDMTQEAQSYFPYNR